MQDKLKITSSLVQRDYNNLDCNSLRCVNQPFKSLITFYYLQNHELQPYRQQVPFGYWHILADWMYQEVPSTVPGTFLVQNNILLKVDIRLDPLFFTSYLLRWSPAFASQLLYTPLVCEQSFLRQTRHPCRQIDCSNKPIKMQHNYTFACCNSPSEWKQWLRTVRTIDCGLRWKTRPSKYRSTLMESSVGVHPVRLVDTRSRMTSLPEAQNVAAADISMPMKPNCLSILDEKWPYGLTNEWQGMLLKLKLGGVIRLWVLTLRYDSFNIAAMLNPSKLLL